MATISSLYTSGNTQISLAGNVRVPYKVEVVVDFADALAAKGSALAASDVIEAIHIPAGTQVWSAGAAVKEAADSTTLTVNVGTGVDPDEWVAALDGVAGTYGADLDAVPAVNTYAAADTIDVTLATLTGTLTSGKVRVWAVLLDVNEAPNSVGLVQLGS